MHADAISSKTFNRKKEGQHKERERIARLALDLIS
jgi:hypothetical protein